MSRPILNELDIYNLVTENSNLTYQNLNSLLKTAFTKAELGPYEDLNNKGMVDVVVIGDGGFSLRDAMLKFIGQDPVQDRASFAICRGNLDTNGRITGNTHWTALHLRRNDSEIQPYYMDSMGGNIPREVTEVLGGIKNIKVEDLAAYFGNVPTSYIQAISHFPSLTIEEPINLPCARQQDGHSCGYHSAFNLVRLHAAEQDQIFELPNSISQKEGGVTSQRTSFEEFTRLRREDLKQEFSGGPDIAITPSPRTTLPNIKPAKDVPATSKPLFKNTDSNLVLTIRTGKINDILKKNLTYAEKLGELHKVEDDLRKLLTDKDESVVTKATVALDRIDQSYRKVVSDFVEHQQYALGEATPKIVEFLSTLNSSKTFSNFHRPEVFGFVSNILSNPTLLGNQQEIEKLNSMLEEASIANRISRIKATRQNHKKDPATVTKGTKASQAQTTNPNKLPSLS